MSTVEAADPASGISPRFVWHTVQVMSWADRIELLRVVTLAGLCEVGLRWLSLAPLARIFRVRLATGPGGQSPDGAPLSEPLPDHGPLPDQRQQLPLWAKRRGRMVSKVMVHWPVDGACLRQSLVLGQRLRRLDPVLEIGVRRHDGVVQAHAWIVVGGLTLDPSAWSYDPFPTLT